MKDDGWLVVDAERRRVAYFGGCKLEGLSPEEAHIMIGMLESVDRATEDEDEEPERGSLPSRPAAPANAPATAQMN